MALYFFYQMAEQTEWLPALASERQNIIRDKKPALVSVLDCDCSFDNEETLTSADIDAIKYVGPLYFDLDGEPEERQDVINSAKELLAKLQAKGVDIDSINIFLSGKKGVHIEVPQQTFMSRVSNTGVQSLPHIYREMVIAFDVPFCDMRVYSRKRGRMWRSPNVKRSNGMYKVAVTADELLSLDVDGYDRLCSSPRAALPLNAPSYSGEMALLFSVSSEKIQKASAKRKANKNAGKEIENLRKKFGTEWPETAINIFNGTIVDPEAGWNRVSFQVALLATALGKSEAELLEAAQPLFESHKSDSDRYNTPAKRRRDLRNMFRYVSDSPTMEYSSGGLLSIVLKECRAACDIQFGEFTSDSVVFTDGVAGDLDTVIPSDDATANEAEEEHEHIRFNKHGIFAKTEDGFRRISELGFTRPISIRKLCGDHIGYEVTVWLDGVNLGKHKIPISAFVSRGQMNTWMLDRGSSMRGTDNNINVLVDVMRGRANKLGEPVYAVEREGIDVVTPPGCRSVDEVDVLWATKDNVISNSKFTYRFNGTHNDKGFANSDLMNAPELTVEHEMFIRNLLEVNTKQNVAKLLGWFSAAFLTQLIRYDLRQYPLLQVFGQAGAGKSTLVELFNRMHYYMHPPRQMSSSGQTMYPIIVAVATSASVPVVFEEFKPREMKKDHKDTMHNIFRCSYRADTISRGSLGRDKASRDPVVTDYATAAPIVFVGEAFESQAAILARCVVVSLSQGDRQGRSGYYAHVSRTPNTMGIIGKHLSTAALSLKPKDVGDTVRMYVEKLNANLNARIQDEGVRAIFNVAVAVTGLEFFQSSIRTVFGGKFDETLNVLKQSLIDNVSDNIPKNMPEAARVLDVMSRLTREADMQYKLTVGSEYTVAADGMTIDLKLLPAYHKYVRWQRSLGLEILYDNEEAFVAGMSNYAGTIKRACPDNASLYDSPRAKIFRISVEHMSNDGVDLFDN